MKKALRDVARDALVSLNERLEVGGTGRHRDYTRGVDLASRSFGSCTGPAHRAGDEDTGDVPAAEAMFDLEFDVVREELRVDLADFLIGEKGWPANAFTAHAMGLFATAVHRRYVEARGHEPEWDRGPVYRGFTDYMIVRDTYEAEMGALAEQLAHEGLER